MLASLRAALLTLKYGWWSTGEWTLFTKRSSPRAAEYGVVDVGLIRHAAIHRLTANDTIPRSVETLQLCLPLRRKRQNNNIDTIFTLKGLTLSMWQICPTFFSMHLHIATCDYEVSLTWLAATLLPFRTVTVKPRWHWTEQREASPPPLHLQRHTDM